MADQTSAQQIATMQKLAGPAAAWLVNLSARTLRDYPIPRDDDGHYSAQDLLQWARSRTPRPQLPDADLERIMLVVDALTVGTFDDGLAIGLCDAMSELERKHGDGVRVVLADELMARLTREAEYWRGEIDTSEPTAAEVKAELSRQRVEHAEFMQRCIHLRVTVVCDMCNKIRSGTRWTTGKVPKGYIRRPGMCDSCRSDI